MGTGASRGPREPQVAIDTSPPREEEEPREARRRKRTGGAVPAARGSAPAPHAQRREVLTGVGEAAEPLLRTQPAQGDGLPPARLPAAPVGANQSPILD
jgi:hypothetical protein